MNLVNVNSLDIAEVAKYHQKNLLSPGSKIGQTYLERFYSLLIQNPKIHYCVAVKSKGKIVGVITATTDFQKTQNILKSMITPKILLATIFAVLHGKVSIAEILNRAKFEYSMSKKMESSSAYILVLFVVEDFRHQGVGKRLVKDLIKTYKKLKLKTLYVDTYISNQKARKFYKSLGFKENERVTDSIVLSYDLGVA